MMAKLRPNVLLIALMVAVMMVSGLWMVLAHIQNDVVLSDTLLSVLLGYTLGAGTTGLLALAMRVATDPPPPSIPAKEFPEIVRAIRGDVPASSASLPAE